MKLTKYFAIAAIAVSTICGFSSCSDDDDLASAPRLFRPVATLEASSNNLIAKWDPIKGSNSYQLELYRLASVSEDGLTNNYELVTTATTAEDTYTFSDLAWDEKYKVSIKGIGEGIESKQYDTDDISINYISKLKSTKLIDNAARISWDQGGDKIKTIVAIPAEGDTIKVSVKDKEYEQGFKDVYGLNPETSYTFLTYSSSDELNNQTYTGKQTGTTKAPTNFDEKYGAGNWLDTRGWDEDVTDTLKTDGFWAQVKDGMTVILRGEQDYKINNTVAFDRSVAFITGPTLGGNARFLSSGGMTLAKGVTVGTVKFEDIDIVSDKSQNDYPVATNTDKGFGGRQVFNINGTKSTLENLIFKNCLIEGYRAVVRAQSANDAIHNVSFDGCTINGVGDQGLVTTTNKAADLRAISFKDCTITNVVMLCDLRASAQTPTMDITNCTFCYAPIETTVNGNTPLLRFGKNNVTLNINNTLFGPSLATVGSEGGELVPNTAGTAGSVFLDNQAAQVSANHSYKTNFSWTSIGEGDAAKTYPIESLMTLSFDEKTLWADPANGNFTVVGNVGEPGIGASKWINN